MTDIQIDREAFDAEVARREQAWENEGKSVMGLLDNLFGSNSIDRALTGEFGD